MTDITFPTVSATEQESSFTLGTEYITQAKMRSAAILRSHRTEAVLRTFAEFLQTVSA